VSKGQQQQKKNKTAPSSAGQRGQKYKGFFSESANQRYFEKKLRRIFRSNGHKAAADFVKRYSKYGLGRLLDELLSNGNANPVGQGNRSNNRSAEKEKKISHQIISPNAGAAGRDLPPVVLSLAEKFVDAGITPDKFPAKRKARRRKQAAKRRPIISPDMSRVEPDKSATTAEVLGPILSL